MKRKTTISFDIIHSGEDAFYEDLFYEYNKAWTLHNTKGYEFPNIPMLGKMDLKHIGETEMKFFRIMFLIGFETMKQALENNYEHYGYELAELDDRECD